MNRMSNQMKYCHNCNKTFFDDNPHSSFCSYGCQQKYQSDKEKWDRLKREKQEFKN